MSETADSPEMSVRTNPDADRNDGHNRDSQQETPSDEEIEEIEEIEPTSEEVDGGSLFDGVEDAESSSDSDDDDASDGHSASSGDGPSDDSDGTAGTPQFEQAINQGAARLAVVGLDEDEHEVDELEAEFHEVFATFRLGHFGAETIDEYVMVDDDEDVNPAWGLAAAIAGCVAFSLWVRPDGDEQIKRAKEAINSIANGQGVVA
jgi:hypothetical protein